MQGLGHAYDRVKQALHLHTDRGQALREAVMACRKVGTLSVLGVYGLMDKFPLGTLMNKGITVRTAQQHGHATCRGCWRWRSRAACCPASWPPTGCRWKTN
jgi:threonine dehydrogenase-like Zn-dependent dehydrogenase